MKILLYSHAFWPMVGGVETYTNLLASGLSECSKSDGIRVTAVTDTAGPSALPSHPVQIQRSPSMIQLWRLIRQSDVVMLAGPALLPLALGVLSRKPVIVEHHGYQACCPNGLLLYQPDASVCPERFVRGPVRSCFSCNRKTRGALNSLAGLLTTVLRRSLCHFVTLNICVSSHVEKRLHLPRTRVIYHGLPAFEAATDTPIDNSRPLVFAYVGRISDEKGLPLLLQAAAQLISEGRVFKLRIVGDGPKRAELEVLAKQLNLTGMFSITGFLEGHSLARELALIDVVVMPSIWEETAGLSAMEQMMRGKLVIAADIGGLGEVVGQAGLKFNPGSVSDLARCIRQVIDRPSIAVEVGVAGKLRATKYFSLDRMIREHIVAFQEVLHRPANS